MEEIGILGAGPSGLCAAINLARGGRNVRVFEREPAVGMRFHPNMQGLRYLYVAPEKFIADLGLQANVKFHYYPKAIICTRKRKVGLDCSKGSLMPFVERGGENSLEAALFAEAEKLGVEFEFNSRARESDATIIANGSRGEPDQAAIGSVFENSDFPRDAQLVVFDDRYSPRGWYSYVLPVGKDRVEFVTCVSKPYIPKLALLHQNAMKERGEIAEIVGGRKRLACFGGSASARIPRTAFVGGKYYVGEAAGFQDPYMGFGIAHALRSGHFAAKAISEGKDYDRLWKESFLYYLKKDAAYRFSMWLAGDSLAELVMSRYKDGQSADISGALPERNAAYRAIVEGVYLAAAAKRKITGSW